MAIAVTPDLIDRIVREIDSDHDLDESTGVYYLGIKDASGDHTIEGSLHSITGYVLAAIRGLNPEHPLFTDQLSVVVEPAQHARHRIDPYDDLTAPFVD